MFGRVLSSSSNHLIRLQTLAEGVPFGFSWLSSVGQELANSVSAVLPRVLVPLAGFACSHVNIAKFRAEAQESSSNFIP